MYGNDMLKVCAKKEHGKVSVTFDGKAENLKVLLHNVGAVQNLSGAVAESCEQGTMLKVNAGLGEVAFTL